MKMFSRVLALALALAVSALAGPGDSGEFRDPLHALAAVFLEQARLRLSVSRPHAKAEGDAWWDGIQVRSE